MTIQCISDNQMGEMQPDGSFIRVATYGASINNAFFFNELIQLNDALYLSDLEQIIEIEKSLVPALRTLNMIGFFTPYEWLLTTNQGRIMIVLLYLEKNTNEINEKIVKQIQFLYPSLHDLLKKIADKIIK